jgi:hypothetical protein
MSALGGGAGPAPPRFRVKGRPTRGRLGVSGDASKPAARWLLRARPPCMKKEVTDGTSVFSGRGSISFFLFFRSAVFVGGDEGSDEEIKSEQASTCSAALPFEGGVEGPCPGSAGEVPDRKSSISMADDAMGAAETGSEAGSEAKEKAVISKETNQRIGYRQGSWRE